MRSGKIISINDHLIEELIADSSFIVEQNAVFRINSKAKKRKLGCPDKERGISE